MKKLYLKSSQPWMFLLVLSEIFFAFIVWLVSPESFKSVVLCIALFACMIFIFGYFMESRQRKKQQEAVVQFLNKNDEKSVDILMAAVNSSWHPVITKASNMLLEKSQAIEEKKLELADYQEFIEAWVHEIKTPLTVLTLALENHKEDMSPYVYKTMEHVRHSTSGNVEKILHYARLQAEHMDYKLEKIDLKSCVLECLGEFESIAREKLVDIQLNLSEIEVTCDRRVLSFMLSQLLSNAFKYTSENNGIVQICCWEDEKIHLAVRDNGKMAPKEDIPFLFDKGFTGSSPERQNATGMGLYLVKKYTYVLSLEVAIEPEDIYSGGFGIELIFPKVN